MYTPGPEHPANDTAVLGRKCTALALLPEPDRAHVKRRLPVVAVTSYVCPTCHALHEARVATLALGCDALKAA